MYILYQNNFQGISTFSQLRIIINKQKQRLIKLSWIC